MNHAALVQVKIDPHGDIEHRRSILKEFIIPAVTKLPGFKKAIWLTDSAGVGTCIATFDTQDRAATAVDVLAPSNGPEVISSSVCAIEMEA